MRRTPFISMWPLRVQMAAFLYGAVAACIPADGAQATVGVSARSQGTFPVVTVQATVEPPELVFQDAGGRELRRQAIRDRSGRLSSSVCAIVVAPERHSFLVFFADIPEFWEVSYNPTAPEIGLGMVHDFQYREGQFAPGYLHPLRTSLPSTVARIALGQDGHTVLLDPRTERAQPSDPLHVHLDVRKPIREPAYPRLPWVECIPELL